MKYNELLQRCQQASDQLTHKAVQTATGGAVSVGTRRRLSSSATLLKDEGSQQPEYKALFNEIFTHIQKTKVDLSENKHPPDGSQSRDSSQRF